MISKLKKIVLFITATLFVGTSSVFANDINQQTTDPVNINQNNTTINFTNQGCINYVMTSESPAGAISIDNNSANDISNLTIDIGNSSFTRWYGKHVSSHSEDGVDSYAINLSHAKSGFRLDFTRQPDSTGTDLCASSNISDSKDNNPKSAVIYLPESVSNDVNDKTIVNFGTINANFESNIQKIASYDPCSSTTIGIPIIGKAGANNISLQKNQSNSGSTFSSQASAFFSGIAYNFDEVNSTVFGCSKVSAGGLAEGEKCDQLCNFDLSEFDLSKDEATSTSPRYASVIGAARVIASDSAKNVTINQFNNLHVKNTPKTAISTAGIESSDYADAYAVVLGGGYVGADLTHGADDNESYGIFQFNDVTIDTISGSLKAEVFGNHKDSSAAVVGCAKLNTIIGDSESDETIKNGHVSQFNNMSIGEISSEESTSFNITSLNSSSKYYTSVIGSAYDELTIHQNSTNSTIEKFSKLKVGNISGELNATGGNFATVIGSGYSKYTLNGSGSNVQRFNDITIGGINSGAKLSSASYSDCSAVIGSPYEMFVVGATNSTLKEFSNLKVGNIAGTLKSEVIGNGNVYGSAVGCACLNMTKVSNPNSIKMFSDVSVQFQKKAIASSIGTSTAGAVYLNTLGGQYNGYYGEENNDIADGMRFYFNGVGKSSDNDIVIAALEHDNDAPKTYSLTDECRSFAMGPNFQINVGRNRVIDSATDRETRFSIENGGVRSGIPGTLRILGNISKSQQNAGCENATMRIDGGWDVQCFGKVSDLQTIDIVEGTLSLMGSGNACKAELGQAIKRIDDTGVIGDGFKGSLTLADGQMLRFGVSGNLDAKTNEKFASKAFRSSDGRVKIRNDGQDDAGMLNLDGGKFSLNIKSRENIPSNSCFYVIRVDNPHDEDTNGSLINVDPAWYEVSDENFNEGGYFGNVKMYKITDSDDKSIVSGKIGILSKNNVHAYKICDQSDQLLGIAIGPEEYGVNDLETITDCISKSGNGVAVAQGAVASISSITSCVCSCIANGGTNASSQISDESSIAGIISGEQRARYIGGGNYALSTQYKNRYSLNPKLFFSPFGGHGHQDKVSGLGHNYNLYGFTVGGSISKYLQSEARISVGIFGSFSDNTTKYCGEKSHLGMRNGQKMYFGGVFGSYEDHDISGLRTNLSVIVGGGRFKNKTWTRITDGGKVRAKFNSSDFHASADFVKNMINIGNSDFHCGPWVALSYNHIHENGHNVVCNGENIANVSSTRFDFLDTTLGINFEKNISYSPEKNISGRIFAKAGWFCRPVRSHSSCTVRADGIDPINPEFRFSDSIAPENCNSGFISQINNLFPLVWAKVAECYFVNISMYFI